MCVNDRSAERKSHVHAGGLRREDAIGPPRIAPRSGIFHGEPGVHSVSTGSEVIVSTFGRSATALIASIPFMMRFGITCRKFARTLRTTCSGARDLRS
jgi:hypothetical protein